MLSKLPRPLNSPRTAALFAAGFALALYAEFATVFLGLTALVLLHYNTTMRDERQHAREQRHKREFDALSRQQRRFITRKAARGKAVDGAPVPAEEEELSAYSVFNRGQRKLAGEFSYDEYERALRQGGMG